MPVLLFFMSFSKILPSDMRHLLRLRLVPTLLKKAINLVIFRFLLTLMFKHVCYSAVYPTNMFRSVVGHLFYVNGGGGGKDHHFACRGPVGQLHCMLLMVATIVTIFNLDRLYLLLSPCDGFKHVTTDLFHPVIV